MHVPNLELSPKAFEPDHINHVLDEITDNFPSYFSRFCSTTDSNQLDSQLSELSTVFKVTTKKKKSLPRKDVLLDHYQRFIEDFSNNQQKYIDFLDIDYLEEYEDDPAAFKSYLKNSCPIIHNSLWSPAKEMDKYREAFYASNPSDLLRATKNITRYANEFYSSFVDSYHESKGNYEELSLSELSKEDYIVYGVIGNGIKSHFLYKMHPEAFPNRSRNSIYALYYLTAKKTFGFKDDSEFLMIDVHKSITQQNYFYPYDLFSFYALKIYLMLKKASIDEGVSFQNQYRYVYLDTFLDFVANQHMDEINELKKNMEYEFYH